jgi:hypothetical protein
LLLLERSESPEQQLPLWVRHDLKGLRVKAHSVGKGRGFGRDFGSDGVVQLPDEQLGVLGRLDRVELALDQRVGENALGQNAALARIQLRHRPHQVLQARKSRQLYTSSFVNHKLEGHKRTWKATISSALSSSGK